MTKRVKTKEAFEWVQDDLHDALMGLWMKHCNRYHFDYDEEMEAYGDTYVSSGRYLTDESDEECREDFEKNLNADELLDELKMDSNFKDSLNALIEAWAWEKELAV